MKDLIKENATYKLFLIDLLDSFENNYKESKDKELKRYFKDLSKTIEQVLNINDKHINKEKIDKAIEYCEEVIKEHNNGEYNVSTVELAIKEHKGNIKNILDILKEDK